MNQLVAKHTEIKNLKSDLLLKCGDNQNKRNKIEAFSDVCEKLIEKGADILVTLVVQNLTQRGIKISSQSVYNKQEGNNPYRLLFDAWNEYSQIKKAQKNHTRLSTGHSEIIEEEDLMKIPDPVLRYKFSLMYGEIKGLKKQNDMLRQIKEMPSIQAVPMRELGVNQSESIMLDSYEVGLIRTFVAGSASLNFDENGKLIANSSIGKGTSLSAEGLRDALKKVLNSYTVSDHG